MPTSQKPKIVVPGYLRISKIVVWALYVFVLIGIASLLLRIFLMLFSANPEAGFAQLVANVSKDYLEPFREIFPMRPVGETGYLDVSAMFAVVVYLFVLWGVHSLVTYIQNKIDLSVARQEKELAEMKRQKMLDELAAQKNQTKSAYTSQSRQNNTANRTVR